MINTHQESQQSGSGNNEVSKPFFGDSFNGNQMGLNQNPQAYNVDTDVEKTDADIAKRVNILKDVLNTDMDDELNTLDKDSVAMLTGNEMNKTLGDMMNKMSMPMN
jgi:hypothetical protein